MYCENLLYSTNCYTEAKYVQVVPERTEQNKSHIQKYLLEDKQ